MISQLNDINFTSEVINANRKVCVMFTAEWAGPCNLAAPMFEQLAEGAATDEYLFGVFDIGDNPETPRDYGLRSVPCFMVFDRDVLMKSLTGAVSAEELEEFLS
jgi:thioredoxin 1